MNSASIFATVLARMPKSMFEVQGPVADGATRCTVKDQQGNEATIEVEVQMEQGSSVFRRPTNIFRVKVQPGNCYGRSEHLSYIRWHSGADPVKLDEFWCSKVASACSTFETLNARKAKETKARMQNELATKEVLLACGLGEYNSCCSSGYRSGDRWVEALNVHFKHLTKEQAIAIINAAKAAGVRLS